MLRIQAALKEESRRLIVRNPADQLRGLLQITRLTADPVVTRAELTDGLDLPDPSAVGLLDELAEEAQMIGSREPFTE